MRCNDGELAFQALEMRKHELMGQAKMERLARKAKENPSQIQQGWMRLIVDLIQSPITRVKYRTEIGGLNDIPIRFDPQDNGAESA